LYTRWTKTFPRTCCSTSIRSKLRALPPLIDRAFYKKYVIDEDYGTSRYVSEIREVIRVSGHDVDVNWEVAFSDADAYDSRGLEHGIRIDPEPTGIVFRDESSVQVCMRGDSAVITDETNRSIELRLGSPAAKAQTSTRNVFLRIKDEFPHLSARGLLAMKRAADWAQVERCARFGGVFVTRDVLVALYAFYRGVAFVLLRTKYIESTDYEHYYVILGKS
jgi:hypothetical protein